jgi:tetrahydromethanopterin S-methyltransferase subunit B
MPIPGEIDTNKIPTRLTELQVNEVSLVSKGAIGEVFSIMKSDEEPVEKGTTDVVSVIQGMPDQQFVSTMKQMMDRYQQINKNMGGSKMERDEIVGLVADVIAKSMETVNSNFAKINKSIDDIEKKVAKPAKSKAPADDPDGGVDEDTEDAAEKAKEAKEAKVKQEQVKKSVDSIGEAVKSLAETVGAISKSMEGIAAIGETVKKMAEETLPGISTRVEAIEKQEQPPAGVDGVGTGTTQVTKSGAKWPSFVSGV